MATVSVINAKQEKLCKLSDSERAEKVTQLLGVLDELEYLAGELKRFKAENKDQKEDAEKRLASLREDLGMPESNLSPEMLRARLEERERS